MSVPVTLFGQSGITNAASQFSSTATTVKASVKTGCLAIAVICGAIGLVGALSKSTVEGEQASKTFIKWFVAAGFFALAWGVMETLFA